MTRARRSISASILFHFLFVLIMLAMWQQQLASPRPAPKLTWIDLEPLPPKVKQANDESKKQVVQTMPGHATDHAPKDAYLGEHNQTVDRQTVSRDHSTVVGAADPARPQVRQAEPSKPKSQPKERAQSGPRIGELSNFGLPIYSNVQNKTDEQIREEGEKDRNWANDGTQQLQDYVKGLKEGEQTALNTREYMFYGYFHRIRERLDRAWVPILRERLVKWYRSGRTLASDQEHATRVLVVLNRAGEITRVEVVSDSGVQILDEAAVQAFNRAGPFPNPPKGLVDQKGEIEVPWEFVLRT